MKLEELHDNDLLILLDKKGRQGERAFRFIYNKYSSRLMAYCRKMMKNQTIAEDIFQETFIRFYKNAKPNQNKVSIIGYLIRIGRNLCYDHYRSKINNVSLDDFQIDLPDNDGIYSDDDQIEEKFKLLMKSLDLLSAIDKELLILRIFHRMKYREIAEILDIDESNARKKVFRAKIRLKKIIEPYYEMFEK